MNAHDERHEAWRLLASREDCRAAIRTVVRVATVYAVKR